MKSPVYEIATKHKPLPKEEQDRLFSYIAALQSLILKLPTHVTGIPQSGVQLSFFGDVKRTRLPAIKAVKRQIEAVLKNNPSAKPIVDRALWAKDKLLCHNMRGIIALAKSFAWSGVEEEDLITWAIEGFTHALWKYQPGYRKLNSYAWEWSLAYVREGVRKSKLITPPQVDTSDFYFSFQSVNSETDGDIFEREDCEESHRLNDEISRKMLAQSYLRSLSTEDSEFLLSYFNKDRDTPVERELLKQDDLRANELIEKLRNDILEVA